MTKTPRPTSCCWHRVGILPETLLALPSRHEVLHQLCCALATLGMVLFHPDSDVWSQGAEKLLQDENFGNFFDLFAGLIHFSKTFEASVQLTGCLTRSEIWFKEPSHVHLLVDFIHVKDGLLHSVVIHGIIHVYRHIGAACFAGEVGH